MVVSRNWKVVPITSFLSDYTPCIYLVGSWCVLLLLMLLCLAVVCSLTHHHGGGLSLLIFIIMTTFSNYTNLAIPVINRSNLLACWHNRLLRILLVCPIIRVGIASYTSIFPALPPTRIYHWPFIVLDHHLIAQIEISDAFEERHYWTPTDQPSRGSADSFVTRLTSSSSMGNTSSSSSPSLSTLTLKTMR